MTRKQRRLILIGAGAVVLAVAATLVLTALRDSIVFFNSPTDVIEKKVQAGTRIRLGGEETYSDALPFRGTALIYENIFNAYQLNRGNDLTYNPYYAMSLSARARWYFTDPPSLRLPFDL